MCASSVSGQKAPSVIVNVDQPKARIQPTMWGIFFEDINFAADGGVYAELVKNRSFEFANPRMGWNIEVGSTDSSHFTVFNRSVTNPNNPRFARVKVNEKTGSLSITNVGFRGMGVKKDNPYHFSVMASVPEGSHMTMNISLISEKGEVIGQTSVVPQGTVWKKYAVAFTATKTDPKARLRIRFEGKGMINIDMVSLFPDDTWKNRPGGLRADLVQLLADMKPGFLRFPGGCIVEGRELATRYQWKTTIGNVEDRKLIVNRWNTEFAHRLTPDYYQTFGLGFYEYFLLSEDIGAEPLPILNCGMACQFNTTELVPMEDLDPYVQDALDLIEFANGPATSKWGAIRASMGHPEPFHMKYMGVGNEQWGPQYFERYAVFEKAILAKYPDMKLVSGTGPAPSESLFDFAKEELKKYHAAIVDEHYYRAPEWFFENATRYDNYDRNTYKIFAGEYAAQSEFTCSPDNKNNWKCALSEAAFMTGLERNADVVHLSSYAPLFAHTEGWQWTPDLIWFDNLTSYGTPNYYVQKMFSVNKGTDLLTMSLQEKPLVGENGLYGSAVWDATAGEIVLKLVNAKNTPVTQGFTLNTKKKVASVATQMVMKSSNFDTVNSIAQPQNLKPEAAPELKLKGKTLEVALAPQSFTVIRIKVQ